jgi:hypothetical protein
MTTWELRKRSGVLDMCFCICINSMYRNSRSQGRPPAKQQLNGFLNSSKMMERVVCSLSTMQGIHELALNQMKPLSGKRKTPRRTKELKLTTHRTNKPGSPTLPSSSVQQLFEEAESDVLLLYDSCHSSHPAVDISGQGVTEVIAACGFETETPIPGPHSFTNALIQVLEEVFTGPPISVAELHSRVLRELKNWKPSYLRDRSGHILIDPKTGRPKYECPKRRTPVHCFLTNETPYRSIMLAPLQTRLSHAAVGSLEEPRDRQNLSQSSLARSSPDDSRKGVASTAPTTISGSSNANKGPQVLLAVRLEDDGFLGGFEEDGGQRLRKWCDWLKVIPEGVKDISIQGVYKSFSTLVLMSMPVVLWNTLPDNPAYSFIGFVTSTNMAPQRFEEQAVEVKETTRNATKKTFDGIIPTLIPNPPLVAETKQIAPKAKVHQKFVETERILITNQARDALTEEGPRLQALDRKPTPLIAASQRPTKISVDALDRTRPPPVVPFEGSKRSNVGASRRPRSLDISRSNIPERSLSDATQRPRSLDISRSEVPARSLSDATRQRDPLMKVIRRRPASILRQKPVDIGQFSDTISSSKEVGNRSRQKDANNLSEHSEKASSHPKPHPPLPQEYQSRSSYPASSTTVKPFVSEQTSMKSTLRPPLPVLQHPFPPSQPLPKLPITKRDPSSINDDHRRRLSTSTKAAREMLAPKHMLRKEKGDRLLYGEYCKPRATEGDFYEAKTGGYWGMSNVA